jgi:CRISPR/Cas system-associated endonuclease Cas3-HD
VATIPYFEQGVDRLAALLPEIELLSVTQDKDLTGITQDKNELADQVIDYLIEVSGAVHSYAEQNGNKALQSLVNYKSAKVVRLDQHDLITAGDIVLNEAQKIPELSNAGISPQELNEFNEALTRLKSSTSNRREAGIEQSGSTKRIAELFSRAEDIKKNTLDRLAPQFQRKAP